MSGKSNVTGKQLASGLLQSLDTLAFIRLTEIAVAYLQHDKSSPSITDMILVGESVLNAIYVHGLYDYFTIIFFVYIDPLK